MKRHVQCALQSSPSGMDTQFFEAVAAKIPWGTQCPAPANIEDLACGMSQLRLYVARAEVDHWHGRFGSGPCMREETVLDFATNLGLKVDVLERRRVCVGGRSVWHSQALLAQACKRTSSVAVTCGS